MEPLKRILRLIGTLKYLFTLMIKFVIKETKQSNNIFCQYSVIMLDDIKRMDKHHRISTIIHNFKDQLKSSFVSA